MPNWGEVLSEIEGQRNQGASAHDAVRRKYLKELHSHTGRHVIAYYSGFLSKPNIAGSDINDDDKNALMMAVHDLENREETGLDIILHTPGGGIAATESLVHYLKQMFGNNIRAIVPQIAMSAGTMMACSCKSIIMSKHSNLGPIDPQFNGIPAVLVKQEFERAFTEINENPAKAAVWQPILSKYTPTFLDQCELAITWSKTFVEDGLKTNMFEGDADAEDKAKNIVNQLTDAATNKAHNKHFHHEYCKEIGLTIEMLEDDQVLQDLVLTVHHCFIHTLSNTDALKIIENQHGRAIVKVTGAKPR